MALYNVERPHNFSSVKGQEPVVKILSRDIQEGNVKHAYLFRGVRGTGKTTLARIIAEAVNCEDRLPDGSPCGKCASCREIRTNTSVDVYELDAASNSSVEDIRKIIEKVQYKPIRKKKVFIIDEFQSLSKAAVNALLKVLEEPPKDVIFIICTTEKVLPTVVSRCSVYEFEKIKPDVIQAHLSDVCTRHNVPFEEKALAIIAKAANGGMRDALSILDKFMASDNITTDEVATTLGMTSDEMVFQLLSTIADKQLVLAIDAVKSVVNKGGNLAFFIEEIFSTLLDVVNFASSGDEDGIIGTSQYVKSVVDLAFKISPEKAFHIMDAFRKVYATKSDAEFIMIASVIEVIHENTAIAVLQEEVAELKARVKELSKGTIPVAALPVAEEMTEESPVIADVSEVLEEIPVEELKETIVEETIVEELPEEVPMVSGFDYEEESFVPAGNESPFSIPNGISFDELQSLVNNTPNEPLAEAPVPKEKDSLDEASKEASDNVDEFSSFMSDEFARLFNEQ